MSTNDELTRWGEPATSPEEEADALRLEKELEERLAGRGSTAVLGINPDILKTVDWLEHLRNWSIDQGDRYELDVLGQLFPQFELVGRLGGGGMGVVYQARHVMLDCPVALKVLRPEFSNDLAFVERFRREARAMALLNHPGIVRLMNFGKAGDFCYLEMEYLAGGTLRDRLKQGPLPPDEALRTAGTICDALQHAHNENVVHRDIKPENILFDRHGQVKIADLGLARVGGEIHLTGSSQGMGTESYMAPEQVRSATTADHRADLYAVGVVLYEMLTGDRPRAEYVPASHKADVDVEVDEIIKRALQTDPDRRFQSAADMKVALKAALDCAQHRLDRKAEPERKTWLLSCGDWLKGHRLTAAVVLACFGLALLGWARMPGTAREEGVLRWGGDDNGGAPYIWEERGTLKGFEVELMEIVAARLKMKPQFIRGTWDMLPQSLRRGDFDVIFNGFEWSGPRSREMNATGPYGIAPLRLIVWRDDPAPHALRDWNDLRTPGPNGKRRVGTLRGSASEKYLREHFPEVEVETPGSGTVEVFVALKSGRLDASVQDELTAQHYVHRDFPELEIVGAPLRPTVFVAYTHRSNPELRDRIDATLREMLRDGTLKRIYTAYGIWNDDVEKQLEHSWRNWPPPEDEKDQDFLWPALGFLAHAASVTVQLAFLAMPLAMLLGLIVAIGRLYGPLWLKLPLAAYVEFVRGTPLLLQLAALYFLLPEFGVFLPAFWAAVIGLAVNYSAYESEHYRAGILSVPRGQMEAALTLGMTRWTALRKIILPQAIRTVVPSVTNDFIALFKDTAVCSVVAVVELTGQYQRLAVAQPQRILAFALLAALLYLLMSYPLSLLARRLERRPQPVAA